MYKTFFQMTFKEDDNMGIISSFNRVGPTWSGGSEALMIGVLRSEWGFKGCVITDYIETAAFKNSNQAIRAGGAMGIGESIYSYSNNTGVRFENALRYGVKTVLYMQLHALYQNVEYNKNPDDGKKVYDCFIECSNLGLVERSFS